MTILIFILQVTAATNAVGMCSRYNTTCRARLGLCSRRHARLGTALCSANCGESSALNRVSMMRGSITLYSKRNWSICLVRKQEWFNFYFIYLLFIRVAFEGLLVIKALVLLIVSQLFWLSSRSRRVTVTACQGFTWRSVTVSKCFKGFVFVLSLSPMASGNRVILLSMWQSTKIWTFTGQTCSMKRNKIVVMSKTILHKNIYFKYNYFSLSLYVLY